MKEQASGFKKPNYHCVYFITLFYNHAKRGIFDFSFNKIIKWIYINFLSNLRKDNVILQDF